MRTAPRRGGCRHCGVRVEPVPWARTHSWFTHAFEAEVLRRARVRRQGRSCSDRPTWSDSAVVPGVPPPRSGRLVAAGFAFRVRHGHIGASSMRNTTRSEPHAQLAVFLASLRTLFSWHGSRRGTPCWHVRAERTFGQGRVAFEASPEPTPHVPVYIAGQIASSDRLAKGPKLRIPWLQTARNLLAIKMEFGGVYRAARERWVATRVACAASSAGAVFEAAGGGRVHRQVSANIARFPGPRPGGSHRLGSGLFPSLTEAWHA